MKKKAELKNELTDKQKSELLLHFKTIYECSELTDHEYNIIYLAWMWANGFVDESMGGFFDDTETDVTYDDYEITFEDGVGGGMNLDFFYNFY